MEPLMRLVVPQLDGGMLIPLLNTAASNINQTATATTDTDALLESGVCQLQFENGSKTGSNGSGGNASDVLLCFQSGNKPDLGKPLLAWYLTRLESQVALLIVASLLWLLLLAVLIAVYTRLRRKRSRRTRRIGEEPVVVNQRLLKFFIILLVTILTLAAIGCTFFILHIVGRVNFSGMSDQSESNSKNDTTTTGNYSSFPDRTQLTANFRYIIDEFDRFIEQSIRETNATVLGVCKETLPDIMAALETIATYLLDRLADDFQLTPLFTSFNEFIELVKLLVDSMRAIKESRSTVVEPLVEFTSQVDSIRRQLQKQTADACSQTEGSYPPTDLCRRVTETLDRFVVGVNYRQLKSDSSVTIVNLLDNMIKLNFSQVEGQVASARGQLYASLDMVKEEVRKQFDQLVVLISDSFNSVLTDAESFRSGLRGAKRDRGFLEAMKTVDQIVIGFSLAFALSTFAFLVTLFMNLFVSIRFLFRLGRDTKENNRNISQNDGNRLVPDNNEPNKLRDGRNENDVPLRSLLQNTGMANGDAIGPESRDPVDEFQDPETLPLPKRNRRSREPRDWHLICLFVGCLLLTLIALPYACTVFYASTEAYMDACRYATNETGLAKIDELVYDLIQSRLWPQIEDLLLRKVPVPLPGLSSELIPTDLISSILGQCNNDSITIFQALGLTSSGDLVKISQVIRSPLVAAQLSKGSNMIQNLVRDLNTSSLIPGEVDDLLRNTLPRFAAVVDAENFAPSIRELHRPLLPLGAQGFVELRRDLLRLQSDLRRINDSDRRAVLIEYFSDQVNSIVRDHNETLSADLVSLLTHYTTLQTNRRLTNLTLELTANAMRLKATLTDKPFLLEAIGLRYNETLARHLPLVVDLLSDITNRLLARVGRCRPLADILRTGVTWCKGQVQPLPEVGAFMMFSCLVFYVSMLGLLTLEYVLLLRTVDGPQLH